MPVVLIHELKIRYRHFLNFQAGNEDNLFYYFVCIKQIRELPTGIGTTGGKVPFVKLVADKNHEICTF